MLIRAAFLEDNLIYDVYVNSLDGNRVPTAKYSAPHQWQSSGFSYRSVGQQNSIESSRSGAT